MTSTEKIIKDFTPQVIKMDASGSVLIGDKNSTFKAWVDVWSEDGETNWDWNQYIFHLDNANDVLVRDIQADANVALIASSLATEYFETNIN